MTPIVLQGDAMGTGLHGYAVSVALDIANLSERTSWKTNWTDSWRVNRVPGSKEKLEKIKSELSKELFIS